jgi:hypothetical protein
MLDRRSLETRQRCAKLFVRPAIDAAPHRAEKRMERERDDTVTGRSGFLIPMHQLHVHVLIERARQTFAG